MESETEKNKMRVGTDLENLEAIRRSGQEAAESETETVEGESEKKKMRFSTETAAVGGEDIYPEIDDETTVGDMVEEKRIVQGETTHKMKGLKKFGWMVEKKIVFRNICVSEIKDESFVGHEFLEDHKRTPIPAYSILQENESGFSISPFDKMLGLDSESDDDDPGKTWFVNMHPYPLQAHICTGSTNAVWQSEIFFISGQFQCMGYRYSDTVIGFHTENQEWNVYPPIQTPRSYHTAVAVSGSIYVFGNTPLKPISKDHWGERFNINGKAWDYLPSPPPLLYELHMSRAHAVYHNSQAFSYTTVNGVPAEPVPSNQNLILFPLPELPGLTSPICVFNCNANSWLADIYPEIPESAPPIYPRRITRLRNQLAVVDGVLFWHQGGSIHGYDLIKQEYLPCLFTLPCNQQHKPPHDCRDEGCNSFDQPMYLIHLGDHKLFFIFQNSCNYRNIHCNKFQVLPSKQGEVGPRLSLVLEAYSLLSTGFMNRELLEDVLVL